MVHLPGTYDIRVRVSSLCPCWPTSPPPPLQYIGRETRTHSHRPVGHGHRWKVVTKGRCVYCTDTHTTYAASLSTNQDN